MKSVLLPLVLLCLLLCGISSSTATAGGKVGIYGIRMVPYGNDAESYSRPSWGGGLHAVLPIEKLSNFVAGTVGIEFVNLFSQAITVQNPATGSSDDQEGDPNYYRFYLGGQIGGHGNGFLRPHAGFDLSLAYYHYPEGVVIYSKQLGQGRFWVSVPGKLAFGYDLSLGLDMNFSNTVALDGGVKYLKGFGVCQPQGEGSVTIYPQYFQIYLGIGYSLDFLNAEGDGNENSK